MKNETEVVLGLPSDMISDDATNFPCNILLDWPEPGPIKSVLLIIIGWLVGWLVGNAVFSETALRIFLIFYMKLGDYKGRKVTELDF